MNYTDIQQELAQRLVFHYEDVWPTEAWADFAGDVGAGEHETAVWIFLINSVEQDLPVETSHLNEIGGVFGPDEGLEQFRSYIQTLRKRQLTAA